MLSNFIKIHHAIATLTLLILFSCGEHKEQPPFYNSTDAESDSLSFENSHFNPGTGPTNAENSEVSVPFREESGVKYVKVSINGFGFEMIFDTGCSGTLISIAEAKYLWDKGYLSEADFLGNTKAQIADGSIVENMKFNLKEIIIDNKIRCSNVSATVSSNINAPLLLGNEVLDRVASYTIDNDHQTINFKLK